jgi:hypothetical protein
LAVLVLVTMPLLLPEHLTLGPGWILPAFGALFLGFVVVADPSRTGGRVRHVARVLRLGLTFVLILAGAWMTFQLTRDLISGGPSTSSANVLLSSAALVWVNNSILFGLLFWELDGGGPARRQSGALRHAGFGFPQQMSPQAAPQGWRPAFVDYLYIGITNGLAYSPTDAMPLAAWAKLTMALQSLISYVVISLVLARAVNILA